MIRPIFRRKQEFLINFKGTVLRNEKKGVLKVVSFDRSRFKELLLLFYTTI